MMNPRSARTSLVSSFRPVSEDPPTALALARAAIRSRNDPESETAPFLSAVERDVLGGAASGVLRTDGGQTTGIALWNQSTPTGLTVEVLHLVAPYQTSERYREFYREIGTRVGPVSFAPGHLAGLAGDDEDRLMRSLAFERFERSEMRYPVGAPDPTAFPVDRLRGLEGSDEPGLARLHEVAYRGQLDRFLFQVDPEPTRDAEIQVREILSGRWGPSLPWASFVVATDEAIAAASLVVRAPYGPLIADVMVEPTRQGQGLGRAVLVASVRALRGRGESTVVLNVTEGNARAIRLYERTGFVRSVGPSHGWYSTERIPLVRPAP